MAQTGARNSRLLLLPSILMVCAKLTVGLTASADNTIRFADTKVAAECPVARSLQVDIQNLPGQSVKIDLVESSRQFLHADAVAATTAEVADVCFYQGSVDGDTGKIAVAKQRRNLFSAQFHFNGALYEIPEQTANSNRYTAYPIPSSKELRTCGVSGRPVSPLSGSSIDSDGNLLYRSKRAVLLDVNSAVQPTDRKYIRLILVGDMYFFERRAFGNLTVGINRLWEIGNYVNALYKQLGVNVIIVHTEVWQADPYVTTINNVTGVAESKEMLDHFMNYKARVLNPLKSHSAAHLVSGLKMSGSDVGLAHVGRLCSATMGGGVNSDLDNHTINSAVTIAHELGHNLGLNHDEDEKNCSCPDTHGCIMAAVGGDVNPLKWSNCSVFRFLDFTVDNGLGYCMTDPPRDSDVETTKSTCGNRIVEPGEDCDCGFPQWCNNTCCDPTTCKFTSGSSCASGQCCNKATCSLMSQGVVCRPRQRDCDLIEYCNGTSEWCPVFDDYMADGTECMSGKAYCYKGHCQDRESRCNMLFNGNGTFTVAQNFVSGATIAEGSSNGYCSYKYGFTSTAPNTLNAIFYNYTGCSFENQRCGTLYCVPKTAGMGDPTVAWKGSANSDMRFFEGDVGGTATMATYFMLDLSSSGYRDPGLVPNGAECGASKMCVDSQCVTANVPGRCPNCNSKGVCAQSGLCYCNSGFKPPDCLQNGTGGSLLNQPPSSNETSVTTAPPVHVRPTNLYPTAAPRLGCSLTLVAMCSAISVARAVIP